MDANSLTTLQLLQLNCAGDVDEEWPRATCDVETYLTRTTGRRFARGLWLEKSFSALDGSTQRTAPFSQTGTSKSAACARRSAPYAPSSIAASIARSSFGIAFELLGLPSGFAAIVGDLSKVLVQFQFIHTCATSVSVSATCLRHSGPR